MICPVSPGNLNRKKTLTPPLGLAMIAAITPPDVEISLTDENVSPIDFNKQVDLVGITVLTMTAPRAYQIADAFRTRGVKVVLGGIHVSFLPEEASQHADAVVIGESEGTWPRLIEDFKANKMQSLYHNAERPSLIGLPIPRRDLFKKGAYYFPNTLATSRGCPYSCSFCSVTTFFGHTYRCRPVEEVIREVKMLKNNKYIIFLDDNIVGNPKFAKELFRALIPFKIKWIGQCSVTIAKDDELLQLAAASGCMGLIIGFESVSPGNLAVVGKKINVVDEYETVVKRIHSHGIAIHGCFIFGLDEDNENIFLPTLRLAQKMRLESANFGFLTPLPGTAIYQSLDHQDRLITKDWTYFFDHVMFEPKLMSREALFTGHRRTSLEFFSLPSIWRRLGLFRRNLFGLWTINLVYRTSYRRRNHTNSKLAVSKP